jgi:hypothetical protein
MAAGDERDIDLDLALDERMVDRARAALHCVEQLAQIDDDERLELMVRGVRIGAAQAAYDRHASACALVSIAESLDRILLALDDGQPVSIGETLQRIAGALEGGVIR